LHNEKNYYLGCSDRNCKRKLKLEGDSDEYICPNCRRSTKTPTYYYTLSLRVKDASTEYWIDIFGKTAESIMKCTAEEYKNILESGKLKDEKLYGLPYEVDFDVVYYHPEDASLLKDDDVLALKTEKLSLGLDDLVVLEERFRDIISSLDHPNIARFYETFHDQRYFHIVTELCRGKELSKLLKQNGGKIKEKNCRIIIMKIIHAINYCHIHGVVHCDLKPDNIIFETPNEESENDNDNILNLLDLKLIDFGLSSRIKKK